MKKVFVDSFFVFALTNPRDIAHAAAVELASRLSGELVTTAFVLVEIADGLATTSDRHLFPDIVEDLRKPPGALIVPATQDWLERGIERYIGRPDKK
jgi:predicted nucleic acid-binding protein